LFLEFAERAFDGIARRGVAKIKVALQLGALVAVRGEAIDTVSVSGITEDVLAVLRRFLAQFGEGACIEWAGVVTTTGYVGDDVRETKPVVTYTHTGKAGPPLSVHVGVLVSQWCSHGYVRAIDTPDDTVEPTAAVE